MAAVYIYLSREVCAFHFYWDDQREHQ